MPRAPVVPRALAARDVRGLIKLVAERESRKLLGAHILAPEGADSIQTAAVAIKAVLVAASLVIALRVPAIAIQAVLVVV